MRAMDDELVRHPTGIGQPVHAIHIQARQTCRSAQCEARGSATSYDSGLCACGPREHITCGRLQLIHAHATLRCLRHSFQHLPRQRAAASFGAEATSVDQRPNAEFFVNVHLSLLLRHRCRRLCMRIVRDVQHARRIRDGHLKDRFLSNAIGP